MNHSGQDLPTLRQHDARFRLSAVRISTHGSTPKNRLRARLDLGLMYKYSIGKKAC